MKEDCGNYFDEVWNKSDIIMQAEVKHAISASESFAKLRHINIMYN